MYGYDEYYEPTIGDEIIGEATLKLKVAIKNEVKNYFDSIIEENKLLKQENERLSEIENTLLIRQNELDKKEKDLENNFYKKKWSEILKDVSYIGYEICHKWITQEKCVLCDDERKISFTSPQGKVIKQNCDCSNSKPSFLPKEVNFTQLHFYKSNDYCRKNESGYSIKFESKNEDDEKWVELRSTDIREVFEPEKGKNTYNIVYTTLEECQKHCDYLNKK